LTGSAGTVRRPVNPSWAANCLIPEQSHVGEFKIADGMDCAAATVGSRSRTPEKAKWRAGAPEGFIVIQKASVHCQTGVRADGSAHSSARRRCSTASCSILGETAVHNLKISNVIDRSARTFPTGGGPSVAWSTLDAVSQKQRPENMTGPGDQR
jgi:hypothetical protein